MKSKSEYKEKKLRFCGFYMILYKSEKNEVEFLVKIVIILICMNFRFDKNCVGVRKMKFRQIAQFVFCIAGIYVSYLTQGIIQEKLATESFGPSQKRPKNLMMLSLVQGLGCLLVSYLLNVLFTNSKDKSVMPPLRSYSTVGLTAALGPSLGYSSLRNINYSAQVIIKSCKLIPTMAMGVLLYGIHYTLSEWIVVLLLCSGLSVFSFKSSPAALSKLTSPNLLLGYSLCIVNLIFDGYTNSRQDNIKSQHPKTSSVFMMYGTNFWLSVYSAILMISGEILGFNSAVSEFLNLFFSCSKYRFYILQFCLCGAIGQLFIFWIIRSYGSVINVSVTTTRKFASILLSVFWNRTPLLLSQWLGVALVFSGVLGNIYIKNQKHSAKINGVKKLN